MEKILSVETRPSRPEEKGGTGGWGRNFYTYLQPLIVPVVLPLTDALTFSPTRIATDSESVALNVHSGANSTHE